MKPKSTPRLKEPRTRLKQKYSVPSVKAIFPWILLILLLIGSTLILINPSFRIQATPCANDNLQPCTQPVIDALQQFHQQHPLSLNHTQIQAAINHANPQSQQIHAKYLPPHTLSVTYIENPAVATIQSSSDSAVLLVSQNGTVLSHHPNNNPSLASIVYQDIQIHEPGDVITNPAIISSLELISHLSQSSIHQSSIIIDTPQRILVNLAGNRVAVFTSQSDILRQVTSLQLILSESTINPSLPVIDVRYQKPVLKPSF